MELSPEKPSTSFQGLLSVESDKILLIPLATNYDMYKMMPSREAH